MSVRKRAPRAGTVSVQDWVAASRRLLVEKGISAVKVEPLSRDLGVTAGSFYWHFQNRKALHRALLRDWLNTNVSPFNIAFDSAEDDPREQYLALANVWVFNEVFDPALETAIREWSKTSDVVKRLLRRVDANRIGLYQKVFEDFGHNRTSAFVRARTMYFHQIGYYSMKVEEVFEERLLLLPYYAEILAGDSWLMKYQTANEIRGAVIGYRRRERPSAKARRMRLM